MKRPRLSLSTDAALALALGLATFLGLLATERAIGFTRDESFYFYAADLYTPWYLGLASNLIHGRLLDSFSDAVLTRAFGYNWEHPVLMKTLFGLSHWLFYDKLHLLRSAAAYRAPAWALGGVASALLYLIGLRLFGAVEDSSSPARGTPGRARALAAFAAIAFWLTPRNLYDGHLACFDMPITVAWLFVVYCYLRAFDQDRAQGGAAVVTAAPTPGGWRVRHWAVLTGVAYGLALCIKLNSFFYPATFVLHWALVSAPRAFKASGGRALWRSVPQQWLWMALLGPLLFLLHWPYLWPHLVERVGQYLAFHLQHVNYPWAYLHELLREPPFPLFYVVVVTALTVPLPLFALMVTGTLGAAVRLWRQGLWQLDAAWLLVLLNAVFPLLLISVPTVPHFGGTKHWLPGMPFLSLLAADALWRAAQTASELLRRAFGARRALAPQVLAAAFGGATLAVALVGCVHIGGYGDSAYNELCGEGAGAAELGMQRQFWSNNVTGVLGWLNENAPAGARVYFHEVTVGSVQAYKQDGMLRRDLQPVGGASDAQLVPYQYMQEFRQQEFDVWNAFGTTEPVDGLYLDESPNVTVYRRPGS